MSFILWNQILLWIALLITRLLSLLLIQPLVCTWWHMVANFTTSWAIHISHTKNWSDFISEYNVKISLFHRLLCISFSLICHLHGRYMTDIDHFIRDLIIQYYEFHIMKSNTIMNCSSHYKTIVSLTHSTPCMYLMTYGRQFYHFLSDPYISYKKLKWFHQWI